MPYLGSFLCSYTIFTVRKIKIFLTNSFIVFIFKFAHIDVYAIRLSLVLMKSLRSILADLLEEFSCRLRADTCELSEEDALTLLNNVAHIRLSKRDAAQRLSMSERSFDRKIQSGEVPVGRKEIGETKLVWYLDEIE